MLSGFGETAAIEAERERLARQYGVSVAYNPADLSEEAIAILVEATVGAFGSVDILVNNAVIRFSTASMSFRVMNGIMH